MYCGAHVGRVHTHRLTDIQGKKSFTEAINKQPKDWPDVVTERCCCSGKLVELVVDALLRDSFGMLP